MVLILRVDHRLLHGQVAFSWTQNIGADCILIADDESATNELKKSALKLAKPQGVKLVIKTVEDAVTSLTSGVTDKYKLFIVCGSVEAAAVGTVAREGTVNVAKAVYLFPEEIETLRALHQKGVKVECRMLPGDREVPFESFAG